MGCVTINRKGIFTLYEAGLFFVFLIVASTIISTYVNYPGDSHNQRSNFSRYCEESRKALLGATIKETYYQDGGRIFRRDITVRELLIEQIYLETTGIPRQNFSYQQDIRKLANDHFRYGWILRASSTEGPDLMIGPNGLIVDLNHMDRVTTGTITSSSWEEYGKEGKVEITLYLYE